MSTRLAWVTVEIAKGKATRQKIQASVDDALAVCAPREVTPTEISLDEIQIVDLPSSRVESVPALGAVNATVREPWAGLTHETVTVAIDFFVHVGAEMTAAGLLAAIQHRWRDTVHGKILEDNGVDALGAGPEAWEVHGLDSEADAVTGTSVEHQK